MARSLKTQKPDAFGTKGVVRTSGQVAAEAGLHGVARGRQRAAHRCQRAAHQCLRPRKADAAHHALAGGAIQNSLHVRGVVHALNASRIGQGRWLKVVNAVGRQQAAQEGILFDREFMPGGSGMG